MTKFNNMSARKLVILVLIAFFCERVYSEDCNESAKDCMSYKLCRGALHLGPFKQTPETQQLFQTAFCGHVYDSEEQNKVEKVCCDKFPVPDPIESHPNRMLLPESCGDIDGERILGGHTAGLYEFPWMALISYKTRVGLQFKCGGSVINSKYILTTAHCVVNKNIAGVRIGDHDLRYKVDCQGTHLNMRCENIVQDIEVEEIVPHENYQGLPRVMNDIALLRLKTNIDLTLKNSRPICLPVTVALRQLDISGMDATVVGWDLTDTAYESSSLLKTSIQVTSQADCKKLYNRNLDEEYNKEICAGADSCIGIGGGPLMLNQLYNNVLRYVQYGIVSHGPRDCHSTRPTIHTDVTKFMDWILNKLKP